MARKILAALFLSTLCLGLSAGCNDKKASTDPLAMQAREVQLKMAMLLPQPYKEPVKIRVVDKDEVREIMRTEIARDYKPAELDIQTRMWQRLKLVPEEFNLKEEYISLIDANVAGFYMPREDTLYIIRGTPNQEIIAAHELTHAHQDQYYDLDKMQKERRHNNDAMLAFTSLIEGEAMQVMTFYLFRHGQPKEVLLNSITSSLMPNTQAGSLLAVPAIMRESLLFPYVEGNVFATIAYNRDGLTGLRRVYDDPPASTEQILHTEKYFGNRDHPTVLGALPAREIPGKGRWRKVGSNTLGEFGVRILLTEYKLSFVNAGFAAQGWDGDRYALYEDGKGAELLIWISVWDSPAHARRFATTLGKALEKSGTGKPGNVTEKDLVATYQAEGEGLTAVFYHDDFTFYMNTDSLTVTEIVSLKNKLVNAAKAETIFEEDNRKDASVITE